MVGGRATGTMVAVGVEVREGAVAVDVPTNGGSGAAEDKVKSRPRGRQAGKLSGSDIGGRRQGGGVMSYGQPRRLRRRGLGDLAGGALERGHRAGRAVVGHPRLRTGGGDVPSEPWASATAPRSSAADLCAPSRWRTLLGSTPGGDQKVGGFVDVGGVRPALPSRRQEVRGVRRAEDGAAGPADRG